MQQPTSGQSNLSQQQHFQTQGAFPVSNEEYDLVSALANELQGLEKFQKYAQDSRGGKFWQDAMSLKRQLAELFTHELAEHAREGKFGTGQHRSTQ